MEQRKPAVQFRPVPGPCRRWLYGLAPGRRFPSQRFDLGIAARPPNYLGLTDTQVAVRTALNISKDCTPTWHVISGLSTTLMIAPAAAACALPLMLMLM